MNACDDRAALEEAARLVEEASGILRRVRGRNIGMYDDWVRDLRRTAPVMFDVLPDEECEWLFEPAEDVGWAWRTLDETADQLSELSSLIGGLEPAGFRLDAANVLDCTVLDDDEKLWLLEHAV